MTKEQKEQALAYCSHSWKDKLFSKEQSHCASQPIKVWRWHDDDDGDDVLVVCDLQAGERRRSSLWESLNIFQFSSLFSAPNQSSFRCSPVSTGTRDASTNITGIKHRKRVLTWRIASKFSSFEVLQASESGFECEQIKTRQANSHREMPLIYDFLNCPFPAVWSAWCWSRSALLMGLRFLT